MAALIIPNSTPFGGMTNQTVAKLLSLNTTMGRLKDAIATASSGYTGTPGTEFEARSAGMNTTATNNFGVQPDPASPGQNGTDYAYAVGVLTEQWALLWTAAEAAIDQLDNGGMSM
jgi:hypothetical protein